MQRDQTAGEQGQCVHAQVARPCPPGHQHGLGDPLAQPVGPEGAKGDAQKPVHRPQSQPMRAIA